MVVFIDGSLGQIGAIALGAIAGLWLLPRRWAAPAGHLGFSVSRRHGAVALVLFALLFGSAAGVGRTGSQALALFDAFYRSGALVFGGGHVVLPLLQAEVVPPGWVGNAHFLAGYGVAQAVPGRSSPLRPISARLDPLPTAGWCGHALIALSLPGVPAGLRHAAVLGLAA